MSKKEPTETRQGDKPHHHHALVKASAKHLHDHGHIDQATHDEIVAHAERGMKAAKKRGHHR